MTAPIGPGDWVEALGAPPGTPEHLIIKGPGKRGAVWRVAACGVWNGLHWLMGEGMKHPGDLDARWRHVPGWDARAFRPIYPGGKLIPLLLEKLPEDERVSA